MYDHNTIMQPGSIAQLLSTLLYSRRFFPYYVYNVLAGLDDNGEGCLYSYDPVGHHEKVSYTAGGSSGVLMQPFLDSWVSILIFIYDIMIVNFGIKSMAKYECTIVFLIKTA